MFSLFLDSGIQYISYPLPHEYGKSLGKIRDERLRDRIGTWNKGLVDDSNWASWRLTRRENAEDSGEFYELTLAIDTTSGSSSRGFIAESERHFPDEPYSFVLAVSKDELSLRRSADPENGFLAQFDLISSEFGGDKIKVAFVLDVGNSRTLGLLVDQSGSLLSLHENVFPFILRGKEDPATAETVFPTDIELALSPIASPVYPGKPRPLAPNPQVIETRQRDANKGGFLASMKRKILREDTEPVIPQVPSPQVSTAELKHSEPFARDLSIVRLGQESDLLQGSAQDLEDESLAQGFMTGMSSPKRYLWDDEATDSEWFLHGQTNAGPNSKPFRPLTRQRIQAYLADDDVDWPTGDEITAILEDTQSGMSAAAIAQKHRIDVRTYRRWKAMFQGSERLAAQAGEHLLLPTHWPQTEQPAVATQFARYPRRTAMVWLLFDLFVRAWEQINSPQFRSRVRQPNRRRILQDIVITFPACMPPEEKKRYQIQATKALGIFIEEVLSENEELPNLNWEWDEARAVHMVYLYSATRAAGLDGRKFFGMFARSNGAEDPQIRIGNLDIGGGTSDLAVIDYSNTADLGVAIRPEMVFQDGLRIGGDDVLQALIQQYVLPQFSRGVGLSPHEMSRVITGVPAWTPSAEAAAYWRRRWMRNIWIPLATALLERMATRTPPKSVSGFRCASVCRDAVALRNFSIASRKSGHELKSSPDSCLIPVELDELATIIANTLDRDMASLCGAAISHSPDFVVVSGRITAVSAVREIILQYLPLPPQRILFLHGYRVGDWYPQIFRDSDGCIVDAKSAVAVGATIGLLAAEGKLHSFNVQRMVTTRSDPGYFWGSGTRLNRILEKRLLGFSPDSEEGDEWSISPAAGEMLLLRKRDQSEDAPAEPVYELRLKDGFVQVGERAPEFTFQLEEVADGSLVPRLSNVEGTVLDPKTGERELRLEDVIYRFMTLDEERYFLDSGLISIRSKQ